jgi:hypothetical protein
MTKQVRQSIAPTHILGSTGTVEGSDLGFRSLTTFPFPDMPTVAGNPIVARGSNSDGEFVRFADGTQMCFRFFGYDAGSDVSTFRATWTFPVAFLVNPPATQVHVVRVFETGVGDGSAIATGDTSGTPLAGVNLTQLAIKFVRIDGAMRSIEAGHFAIGRWF